MAQPWLDELSEDWNSEPHASPSSSPNNSTRYNSNRRVASNISQSRIPHLAHNIRNSSNNGSFLKPRSTRGIARLKESAALSERSPSSLNAIPNSPPSARKPHSHSTVPRRTSSALSDSQNSVQHHTIDKSSKLNDTPEWKKRLQAGDEITSDGFDLFSPSKLEGIFKQSSCPAEPEDNDDENDDSVVVSAKKPWNSLNTSSFPAPAEPYNTYRSMRSRFSEMDVLPEMDEEESKSFNLSAISSEILRQSPIKGMVQRRVSDFELAKPTIEPTAGVRTSQDPRMRTISGRKEICNEVFSPVEDDERSSIRKQALQDSLEAKPKDMNRNLRETLLQRSQRPDSPSSDHDISYENDGMDGKGHSILSENVPAELTSLSLPEDLSMGTQNPVDSILMGGGRRVSALKDSRSRKVSNVAADDTSQLDGHKHFRSSPPPYKHKTVEDSRLSISEPSTPLETSVLYHGPTSTLPSTAGSPLKLFGNRDTYTNNKLMRVLSQFEQDESELELPAVTNPLRMSNFGKGELDAFNFVKEVERPVAEHNTLNAAVDKVFKNVPAAHDTAPDDDTNVVLNKERSPKRRRTLLKDEVVIDGTEVEVKVSAMPDNSLAGKKRRDALPGKEAEQASPDTLANRAMRRPSGSRKASASGHSRAASATEALFNRTDAGPELAEQLANELETFAKSVVETKQDSRKASLATKDYMEEANKVMEFIRARGKPKPFLPEIQEPEELSELNPDAILDLDVDDSTKDSFSRPPSREGRVLPRQNRRYAHHDPQTAKHLMKFRDQEDLDLLTSTSALGTLQMVDNEAVKEAALVPVPEDDQLELSMQSDPPGIRILNDNDKKRKHSASDFEQQDSTNSQKLDSDGSKRTIMTNTSTSSGPRGIISVGTVSIPDTIGTMTFDHEKKIWVKQALLPSKPAVPNTSPESRVAKHEHSEADPFADIPDLSIDAIGEASWEKQPHKQGTEQGTHTEAIDRTDFEDAENDNSILPTKVVQPPESLLQVPRKQRQSEISNSIKSTSTVASKHEERLHNGVPSKEPTIDGNHQPRVVTIAFSSPIASEIPYVHPPSLSEEDIDGDDPSYLPLDDDGSMLASSPARPAEYAAPPEEESGTMRRQAIMGSLDRHEQYRAMTLNRRPVSRIEEYDEDERDEQEMSLVRVNQNELTPMPGRQVTLVKSASRDKSSILCLTPLSEFTLHQVDKLNHPEESYVAERANPKALRQAHGSHALVEDALVKAITDAEPTELFWEELRKLTMQDSGLASLHGLQDYCCSLEYLDVARNRISQVAELPISLRSLNISSNLVNDLTSWTHLRNLQVVNVSGNRLESLECFSGLIHLRQLNASKNRVRHIEGIMDLNGLISLDLSGNDIAEANFHSCELMSLKELDLSKNKMMHLKNLESLPNLQHADFSDNLLEELTIKQEKTMPYLETLCLSRNELTTIDLTAFPMLRRLNVDSNLITDIRGLSGAENLSILSARDQQVTSTLVNDILNTQHECTEVYLSSNSIPESGIRLPDVPNFTLRCLELASCGIQSLPVGFGDTYPNIRILNLNFNALSDLSSLQGSIKLKHILLAKNRIQKMRRTCLTLSRLRALKRVDLRDNPLTVGFYSPLVGHIEKAGLRPYRIPAPTAENDSKWIILMDEVTLLRRRAVELLLAQCCKGLEEVDGLNFDGGKIIQEKGTWERLMGKGVLKERVKDAETTVSVSGVEVLQEVVTVA